MSTRGSFRHWAVLGLGILVAAVLAGGVIASQFGGPNDPEQLISAMDEGPLVRVAGIDSVGSLPSRGVFVQTTSAGQFCLWDAPAGGGIQRRGGCNSLDDPLGGSELSASLSYEGGPEAKQVTDARLIGLVSVDVDSAHVLMSDGTRRSLPLKRDTAVASAAGRFRAFGYRFRPSDFRRGVGPVRVVALDSSGNEIDRQATGFGG